MTLQKTFPCRFYLFHVIPCSPCEFENEVRKSAIDMEEWEKKQKGS